MKPLEPQQILVADDSRTVRRALVDLLRGAGYGVSEAEDGWQALERARKHVPRLALLDIQMPGPSGVECCRRLRADPATRDVRIVMVTTRSELSKVREAFQAGCDGYLLKPVDELELLRKVRQLMDLAEARRGVRSVLRS